MTEEEKDFIYFIQNQMIHVDLADGRVDVIREVVHHKTGKTYKQRRLNVGSINDDGYVRIWCNQRLRMKHRLLFYIAYGYIPDEVDHKNKIRSDNSISNLREVTRKENVVGTKSLKSRKVFTTGELHEICKLIQAKQHGDLAIAKLFNCSRIAIMGIRHKRRHPEIASLYY